MDKNVYVSSVDTKSHLVNGEMTLCHESITDGNFSQSPNLKKVTCKRCIKAIRISMIYAISQIVPPEK